MSEPNQPKRPAKKRPAQMVEEQLSPQQAADRLGVDRVTVFRWIKAGRIAPVSKLGRKCVRIPASAINAFLKDHEV